MPYLSSLLYANLSYARPRIDFMTPTTNFVCYMYQTLKEYKSYEIYTQHKYFGTFPHLYLIFGK
jgi:hypothetical protein